MNFQQYMGKYNRQDWMKAGGRLDRGLVDTAVDGPGMSSSKDMLIYDM
jgi:hypothetical protein